MNTSGLKVTKMLAPYGQASFLKLITKVGNVKGVPPAPPPPAPAPAPAVISQDGLGRTVIRRKALA